LPWTHSMPRQYAWLGGTYSQEWIPASGTDPQILEHALALAQQALALDDSLPSAHSLLSSVYAGKTDIQAIAEGERALPSIPIMRIAIRYRQMY